MTTEVDPSAHRGPSDETADLLRLVLARLDALENKVDRLSQGSAASVPAPAPLQALPALAAMAGDMADGWVRARQREGVDFDGILKSAAELLTVLSKPEVGVAARRLTARLPELVELVERAPQLAALVTDGIDAIAAQAMAEGVDVDQAIRSVLTAGIRLTEVLDSPQFKALLSSGVLAPETLEVVGRAGRALAAQSGAECGRTGLFGALSASSDADIQRAVDFTLGVARRFGRNMECNASLPSGESRI